MVRLNIPVFVRKKAATLGLAGLAWLETLPHTLAELAGLWELTLGETLEGGTEACVVKAFHFGIPLALKVAPPENDGARFASELYSLQRGGERFVELINFDTDRRALLLEFLGSPLREENLPQIERLAVICKMLTTAWREPDADAPTLMSRISEMRDFINQSAKECGYSGCGLVSGALSCLDCRAVSANTRVLCHGDPHAGNLLKAPLSMRLRLFEHTRYKFIDPSAVAAEKEFDLGALMREGLDELASDPLSLGLRRRDTLCALTDADPRAVWDWGIIRCVYTGLLLHKAGLKDKSELHLTVAAAWLNNRI